MVKAKTGGARRTGRRTALIAIASVVTALLLLAGGAYVLSVTDPEGRTPDERELRALGAKLDEVESALRPIAVSFTSEPATGAIDVTAYRERVERARDIVDSTNDIGVSSPQALEVRDLILTGGSQVVTGFDVALDALVSDEPTGTDTAGALVEDGQAALQEARDRLEELLAESAG